MHPSSLNTDTAECRSKDQMIVLTSSIKNRGPCAPFFVDFGEKSLLKFIYFSVFLFFVYIFRIFLDHLSYHFGAGVICICAFIKQLVIIISS